MANLEDPHSLVGQTIRETYHLLACLGRADTGFLYRAQHVKTSHECAVKIFHPAAWRDIDSLERFRCEMAVLRKLHHHHVIQIIDYHTLPDGREYLVSEPLDPARTLAQVFHLEQAPLRPARACHLAAQIADGLHAAHRGDIVHRDVNPANILLSEEEGEPELVKIWNFGLARTVPGRQLTRKGVMIGSPRYMAPEQCRAEPLDGRADQYGLGCLLYEMLTGSVPFSGASETEILEQQVHAEPVPPSQRRQDRALSPRLEEAVLRMLRKDPAMRFPTMVEVAAELRRLRPGPAQLFVAAHQRDRALLQELLIQLAQLERERLITLDSPEHLLAGDVVYDEIRRRQQQADVVLVLISAEFAALEWPLPERGTRVVPIRLRPVEGLPSWLVGLRALPQGKRWLAERSVGERAAAWAEIAREIRRVVNR